MNIRYQWLHWMNNILKARISGNLILGVDEGKLYISDSFSDSRILFTNMKNWEFPAPSIKFSHYTPAIDGYNAINGKSIPAPGLSYNRTIFYRNGATLECSYDILGMIHWSLTRIEEKYCSKLDQHSRVSAENSHAFLNGYLERPWVDEWINLLRQCYAEMFPSSQLVNLKPNVVVTCDIDRPFDTDIRLGKILINTFKSFIKIILQIKSFKEGYIDLKKSMSPLIYHKNLRNIFWLMEQNEKVGNKIYFYIMTGGKHSRDGSYSVKQKTIKKLIQKTQKRQHIIGLHPSYCSYKNEKMLQSELRTFQQFVGGNSNVVHSRQHYLRWDSLITPKILADTEVVVDSSLAYADHPGFRSGTCFPYVMYDNEMCAEMKLIQQPLVLMEASLLDRTYLGIQNYDEAKKKIEVLKDNVRLVGGNFTILWHNSYFRNGNHRFLYKNAIKPYVGHDV